MSTPSQKQKGQRRKGGKGGSSEITTANLSTSASQVLIKESLTRAVVKLSLTGGSFIDTKLYAFSRRTSAGTVDKPRSLYANSTILRGSCKYFEGLLAGGYREATFSSLDGSFPSEHSDSTDEYDYFSDSDLDDEEDEHSLFPPANKGQQEELDTADLKHTEDAGTVIQRSEEQQLDDDTVADSLTTVATGLQGRVVVLPNIAYRTLKALIFYLYYDEVAFAPLMSQNVERPEEPGLDKAPLCSPKSMYRIADQLGLDKLKEKAAADVKSKLSAHNILPELFSTVTATYDDLRTVQVAYACSSGTYATVVGNISPYIAKVATGELAHCHSVVSALFKQSATNSPQTSQPAQRTTCGNCNRVFGNNQQLYKFCNYCSYQTV